MLFFAQKKKKKVQKTSGSNFKIEKKRRKKRKERKKKCVNSLSLCSCKSIFCLLKHVRSLFSLNKFFDGSGVFWLVNHECHMARTRISPRIFHGKELLGTCQENFFRCAVCVGHWWCVSIALCALSLWTRTLMMAARRRTPLNSRAPWRSVDVTESKTKQI